MTVRFVQWTLVACDEVVRRDSVPEDAQTNLAT